MVTAKFNGRIIAERTTVFAEPTSTFEQVALARLQAEMRSEEAQKYAQCPLTSRKSRQSGLRANDGTSTAVRSFCA